MPATFASKAKRFYASLEIRDRLPRGVEAMNPYRDPAAAPLVDAFLEKFFSDARTRVYVFGINPGRFGAGITGITFTDPVALQEHCGIPNGFQKRREASSDFVYRFVEQYGGATAFYRDLFLTATCPLGFVKGGVNYNFYDDPALLRATRPFIVETMRTQLGFGARPTAVLLGTGKLKAYFDCLNAEHGFFKKIVAVEHPRFIMQYRRRRMGEYLAKYGRTFQEALG